MLDERGVAPLEEILVRTAALWIRGTQKRLVVEHDLNGVIGHSPCFPSAIHEPHNPVRTAKSCFG